jgi:hypothetical protein
MRLTKNIFIICSVFSLSNTILYSSDSFSWSWLNPTVIISSLFWFQSAVPTQPKLSQADKNNLIHQLRDAHQAIHALRNFDLHEQSNEYNQNAAQHLQTIHSVATQILGRSNDTFATSTTQDYLIQGECYFASILRVYITKGFTPNHLHEMLAQQREEFDPAQAALSNNSITHDTQDSFNFARYDTNSTPTFNSVPRFDRRSTPCLTSNPVNGRISPFTLK